MCKFSHLTANYAIINGLFDLPLSPSFDIFRESIKWVPMATSLTLSESRIWTFMRLQSGGKSSVKTICSFQMGS